MPLPLATMRQTVRRLIGTPSFTAAAVLTLAVGTGALVTVFAFVNAILIRPLPYAAPDRLVTVRHAAPGLGIDDAGVSDGLYLHYRRNARAFDDVALYQEAIVNLTAGEVAERVDLTLATPALFELLGVRPIVGRLFDERDGMPGAPVVVLLGEDLWRRLYGADPDIVGRTVTINERAREVIGVLPRDFGFPRPIRAAREGRATEVWMNLGFAPAEASLEGFYYDIVARLRPGVSQTTATAELAGLLATVEGAFPDATADRLAAMRLTPRVVSLKDAIVGNVRALLWLLLGGMAFVLLIASANVAGLMLVRAEYRGREIAVRSALGAGNGDIARLFLNESLLISSAGAAGGLLIASWGVGLLMAAVPVELPRLREVRVDGWVVAFAVGVALLAAFGFGLLSLIRYVGRPLSALAGGTRSNDGPDRLGVRSALVVAQLALACVLLAGAGLMVRSFHRIAAVDPGFEAQGVLAMEIGLPASKSQSHAMIAGFYDTVLERVRALPGVEAAGAASTLPLAGTTWTSVSAPIAAMPTLASGGTVPPVSLKFITPGYLQTLRVGVLEGSTLGVGEPLDGAHPVLVSSALARRLFGDESALGRQLLRLSRSGGAVPDLPPYTIVGVVEDTHEDALTASPTEIVYVPVIDRPVDPQFFMAQLSLVVRSDQPAHALAPLVRDIVRDVDPAIGVTRVRTLESIVRASTAQTSFLLVLLLVAAAASLFLGIVGIYGVIAYTVTRRTRELGIRIALGADRREIHRLVLGRGGRHVAAGVLTGVVASLALTRFLRALLFEVSPTDPVTLIAVSLLLTGVALIGCWLPARRAARIQPAAALRAE